MIDIKKFDSNLLKIDKKIIDKNIGYTTIEKIDDYKNIYIVNSLYLTINYASGYIECNSGEKKGVNKYLVFDSTDENKELLKKYNYFFNRIRKKKKKKISGNKCDYEKDYMKNKFNSTFFKRRVSIILWSFLG